MKQIQTKDYLLLIDEEAEIKEKDYYSNTWGNTEPLVCICDSIGESMDCNKLKKDCNKIIAYYPLTKEAKELDLPLLPNPFEDDIEKEALDISELKNKWGHLYTFGYPSKPYPTGFRHDLDMIMLGLYKSKSKQFSLDDMYRVAIEVANKVSRPKYGEIININEIVDTYIQSLPTQQLPKEFIPDYQRVRDLDNRDINGDYNSKLVLKTITNSEGKEILVGTYK